MLSIKEHMFTFHNFTCDYHMVPVAFFIQGDDFPVSELSSFKLILKRFRSKAPFLLMFCPLLPERTTMCHN